MKKLIIATIIIAIIAIGYYYLTHKPATPKKIDFSTGPVIPG